MEYLENIVQLLAIIFSLLIVMFRYISTRQRVWLFAGAFFLANLLSSYFWTAYIIIMGNTPSTSEFLTYMGWNIAFFIILLLLIYLKKDQERRYFHVLMLLPIPLNIWQLTLYLQYGGIINTVYQVVITTFIAVFAVQGIVYRFKYRTPGTKPSYIYVAVLFYVLTEYGMWTFSCFDGWVWNFYYLFSFLNSFSFLILVWAIGRTYKWDKSDEKMLIDKKLQNILKIAYGAIVLTVSITGILFGCWVRDVLTEGLNGSSDTSVYDILPVILFCGAVVLSLFALAVVLIVYFHQKLAENHMLLEEKSVAEQSNAAKSEFLANMSHEIRTPINAVLGMNEMILNESMQARDALPENPDAIRDIFSSITKYAGNVDSAGHNLLSIINDILDFSKIEAGKMELQEDSYQLSSVLNDVSNMVYFKARSKNLDFLVEVDPSLPDSLFGDELRLRQIITNILNNAVKYTKKGSVSLTIRGEAGGNYRVDQMITLRIKVEDTGIGIRKEDLGRLFDKFERMDLKQNSTVEGTGLGLAITKHLLEMMGGTVSVESEYGKGSVFSLCIPQKVVSTEPVGNFRKKFEKNMDKTSVPETLFVAPEAQILVVDDTSMNLSVVTGLLRDTEMKIDTAGSGSEAISMTEWTQYDLILMDQRMPVMDGTETMQQIRKSGGAYKHTPIICLTADAIAGAKERYLEEGFTDYLSKPIDSRALRKMLVKYLPEDKVKVTENTPSGQEAGASKKTDTEKTAYEILDAAGVHTETGLSYCQDDDGLYRTLLIDYVQTSEERIRDLARYFDEKDWKNYEILVHSLKSTSRTIGADEIGNAAAKLESAAASETAGILWEEHKAMLLGYQKIVQAIRSTGISADETIPDNSDILEFLPR